MRSLLFALAVVSVPFVSLSVSAELDCWKCNTDVTTIGSANLPLPTATPNECDDEDGSNNVVSCANLCHSMTNTYSLTLSPAGGLSIQTNTVYKWLDCTGPGTVPACADTTGSGDAETAIADGWQEALNGIFQGTNSVNVGSYQSWTCLCNDTTLCNSQDLPVKQTCHQCETLQYTTSDPVLQDLLNGMATQRCDGPPTTWPTAKCNNDHGCATTTYSYNYTIVGGEYNDAAVSVSGVERGCGRGPASEECITLDTDEQKFLIPWFRTSQLRAALRVHDNSVFLQVVSVDRADSCQATEQEEEVTTTGAKATTEGTLQCFHCTETSSGFDRDDLQKVGTCGETPEDWPTTSCTGQCHTTVYNYMVEIKTGDLSGDSSPVITTQYSCGDPMETCQDVENSNVITIELQNLWEELLADKLGEQTGVQITLTKAATCACSEDRCTAESGSAGLRGGSIGVVLNLFVVILATMA